MLLLFSSTKQAAHIDRQSQWRCAPADAEIQVITQYCNTEVTVWHCNTPYQDTTWILSTEVCVRSEWEGGESCQFSYHLDITTNVTLLSWLDQQHQLRIWGGNQSENNVRRNWVILRPSPHLACLCEVPGGDEQERGREGRMFTSDQTPTRPMTEEIIILLPCSASLLMCLMGLMAETFLSPALW